MRFIPLLLSGVFVILQLIYAALALYRRTSQSEPKDDTIPDGAVASPEEEEAGSRSRRSFDGWKKNINSRGGPVIFAFMVARLLCTLLLLHMSATTHVQDCRTIPGGFSWLHRSMCVQGSLTLAIVSILTMPLILISNLHLNVVDLGIRDVAGRAVVLVFTSLAISCQDSCLCFTLSSGLVHLSRHLAAGTI